MSSSIAPSLISSVGICGRKSFPTKKHMKTARHEANVRFCLASLSIDCSREEDELAISENCIHNNFLLRYGRVQL